MVRNELDIIHSWISHVSACFDHIIVVDHQSIDGTREYLLDLAGTLTNLSIYSFAERGYYQEEVVNAAAKIAAEEYANSWIIPLDVDEFVKCNDMERFYDLVAGCETNKIISLYWRTCIPYSLSSCRNFNLDSPCFIAPTPASYRKVGLHASKLRKDRLMFCQGNHHIKQPDGSLIPDSFVTPVGELFHLPLRNVQQFALKLLQGCLAYDEIPVSRRLSGQGFHWFELAEVARDLTRIREGHLRHVACHYGEATDGRLQDVSPYDLVEAGWRCMRLAVNRTRIMESKSGGPIQREIAQNLTFDIVEGNKRAVFVRTLNRQIGELVRDRQMAPLSGNNVKFRTLAGVGRGFHWGARTMPDISFVREFIRPAFETVENPVPSAWMEHVPFLYCFLNVIRPRRFVELGTHYGNSFYAACQFSKAFGIGMECVAVDSWQGDDHTGRYGEEVFREFEHVLSRDYSGYGRYIKKLFDEAAEQFDMSSIDLLHIDGLHRYDAVKHDYETWFPKLSPRGVVMFHDTQVTDRGFGVWQLWEQLSTEYPSFEMKHGNGLGLIYVGTEEESLEAELFKWLEKPGVQPFLRDFFSRIGKLSPLVNSV